MRTAKSKFHLALTAMKEWIKRERSISDIVDIIDTLCATLLGYFNYYGDCGNDKMLKVYYHQTCRIVFKWLNRRSQRKSYNWRGFSELLKEFSVPQPRIIGYWKKTMILYEVSNIEEPCARIPHAGICEGAAG